MKTKTKKELKQLEDMGLIEQVSYLSNLLNIDYVSSYYAKYICGKTDIYQVYEKPSSTKVYSFNNLRQLYYLNDEIEVIKQLTIKGYNCNKYSTNIVIKYKGREYLLIDTADYRYLYLY